MGKTYLNSQISRAGIFRDEGYARQYFDWMSPNVKKKDDFSNWLSKLDKEEFSAKMVHKAVRLLPFQVEFDEALFWIILLLVKGEEEGQICLSKKDVFAKVISINPELDPQKSIEKIFANYEIGFLSDQIPFCLDMDSFYFIHLHESEVALAKKISEQIRPLKPIQKLERENLSLSDEQIFVVEKSFESGLTFISGGPGTGKTTIVETIARQAILGGVPPEKIIICSPTGKAAKRLSESAQKLFLEYPNLPLPSTIHKVLHFSSKYRTFRKNKHNPLEVELLIVDESSMVDLFLANALFLALPSETDTRVVFIGDPDQLLSVSSGSIFSDLVLLKNISYQLTKSYRVQSDQIYLTQLKNCIASGSGFDSYRQLCEKDEQSEVRLVETENKGLFEKLVSWRDSFQNQNETFQILSPFNEGEGSVFEINASFHLLYSEKNKHSSRNFKEPVIVRKNLYDFNLFNGETGYLYQEGGESFFQVGQSTQKIPQGLLDAFEKAYAITVHKSQGSEYDHVCLVIPKLEGLKQNILSRRILYTAVTRSKKSLTIVGSLTTFENVLLNPPEKRNSNLLKRIQLS